VQANNPLRLFIDSVFALFSHVFVTRVWSRRPLYPVLMTPFPPLTPFLFQELVSRSLSGSACIVIVGRFLNLVLAVSFAASTIALPNPGPESTG